MEIPLLDLVCIGCVLREGTGKDPGKRGLDIWVVAEVDLGVGVSGRWDGAALNWEDKVVELGEGIGVGGVGVSAGVGVGAVTKWKGGLGDGDGQEPSKEG